MTTLVAILASAFSYGALFPPFGWVWLSWVALVPLLLAVRGRSAAGTATVVGLWGFLATALIIGWLVPTLHGHFERSFAWSSVFLVLLSLVAMAPYTAAALAASARARARVPAVLAPLLVAAAWVASELARTHLGVRSPWTKLGDAHYASERLRQIADLTGVYGVSGLVALGNVAAAEIAYAGWRRWRGLGFDRRPVWAAVSSFAVLCSAALVYGEIRRGAETGEAFQVVLVQGNVSPSLRWRRAAASQFLRRYGGLTREALAGGDGDPPDLVVWPENAVQTSLDDPMYGPPLRALASPVPILLGAPRAERDGGGRRTFNSAFLLRPGASPEHYDKRRLLPFSETQPFGALGGFGTRGELDPGTYTAGNGPGLFRLGEGTLGVLICMEALYPEMARELAGRGATVLVNLSNDGWYRGRGGAGQHLAGVVFRAVETRLPLVRATTTGISAVVAPDGRIVAQLGEGEQGFVRTGVPAPGVGPSLYSRMGDAFAIACGAACALGAALPRRRSRPPSVPAAPEPDENPDRDGRNPGSPPGRREGAPHARGPLNRPARSPDASRACVPRSGGPPEVQA